MSLASYRVTAMLGLPVVWRQVFPDKLISSGLVVPLQCPYSVAIWIGCRPLLFISPGGRDLRTHLLHTKIFLFVVWTWHCLWGPMNVTIPYVSHNLVLVFWTAMCVLTVAGCEIVSCYCCLLTCDCSVRHYVSSLLHCHFGEKACWCMGRVSCMRCSYSFLPGKNPSLADRVLQYCIGHSTDLSKASPVHTALSIFIITFNWASAIPLFWGSMAWTFCEGYLTGTKSWRTLLVNCGPHLSTIHMVLLFGQIFLCILQSNGLQW